MRTEVIGDALAEKNRVRLQRFRRENPEWNRDKNAKWKAANLEKYAAHKRVEYAILVGKLRTLPCEFCGTTESVHAHHDNYDYPLNVIWLCQTHHIQRHRDLDDGADHLMPARAVVPRSKASFHGGVI